MMERIIMRDEFSHTMRSIRMEFNIFVLHGSSTIVKVIMSLLKRWHFAARKAISDEVHLLYYYGTRGHEY